MKPYSVLSILSTGEFFVTWGARHHSSAAAGAGAPMPPSGKPLGKLNEDDLKTIIEKGLRLFSKFLYMYRFIQSLCMLGNFPCFSHPQIFFDELVFNKKNLLEIPSVSNSLEPDQTGHFVEPDLVSKY